MQDRKMQDWKMADHIVGDEKCQIWKMANLCLLEFEGLENAGPGKLKKRIRTFQPTTDYYDDCLNVPCSVIALVLYRHVTFCAAYADILTGMGSNSSVCRSRLQANCSATTQLKLAYSQSQSMSISIIHLYGASSQYRHR